MNRLYIGNRRYSSWSLRGWLAVKLAGLEAEEIVIPLAGGNTPEVKAVSPSGFVPYLEHNGHQIWESLAILEYCAEQSPAIWPADTIQRATARAMASEMHAGFRDLRIAMPMVIGVDHAGKGHTPEALANVARIDELWNQALAASGGPFLFGAFGGVDAMFAPVVLRFVAYKPAISAVAQAYVERVVAHPLMAEWIAGGLAEPEEWRLRKYEDYTQAG